MDEPTITLRYVDVAAAYAGLPPCTLLLAAAALKDDALRQLGIERPPGLTHLQAWTLAMCRENGLPEQLPSPEIGDAAVQSHAVATFVWWLA